MVAVVSFIYQCQSSSMQRNDLECCLYVCARALRYVYTTAQYFYSIEKVIKPLVRFDVETKLIKRFLHSCASKILFYLRKINFDWPAFLVHANI